MTQWEIGTRDDMRDGNKHRHVIETGTLEHVIVQVYGVDCGLIPFPGAGPAIKQLPPHIYIPCLHESYYPLTVVTTG